MPIEIKMDENELVGQQWFQSAVQQMKMLLKNEQKKEKYRKTIK